jgi:hypothetical protein
VFGKPEDIDIMVGASHRLQSGRKAGVCLVAVQACEKDGRFEFQTNQRLLGVTLSSLSNEDARD